MKLYIEYDIKAFDFNRIVPAIAASYWGEGRTAEAIRCAFEHSHCVGLFHRDNGQIGWVRAVSDRVYFAYILDLIVMPEFRGKGLGKQLTQEIIGHPDLRNVENWMLATQEHHNLYRPFGFEDVSIGRYMTMKKPI